MKATTIKVSEYLEQNPGLAESTFKRLGLEAGNIGRLFFTVLNTDLSDGESDTARTATIGFFTKKDPKLEIVTLGAAVKSPADDDNIEVGSRLAFVRAARYLRFSEI